MLFFKHMHITGRRISFIFELNYMVLSRKPKGSTLEFTPQIAELFKLAFKMWQMT